MLRQQVVVSMMRVGMNQDDDGRECKTVIAPVLGGL